MSTTTVSKFNIIQGEDNTFVFTIKEDGTTLPITIDPSDTFTIKLVRLSDDTEDFVADNGSTGGVTVTNAASGEITVVIPAISTDSLLIGKGTQADRYYIKPLYKMYIICSTVANGNFIAKVPTVYVE